MMWWYGDGMNVWGYTLVTGSMVLFWGLVIVGGSPLSAISLVPTGR